MDGGSLFRFRYQECFLPVHQAESHLSVQYPGEDHYRQWYKPEQYYTALWEKFKIQHHNSSPYRPKMNCVVEAENKNIKKIIQKMKVTYKD